MASQTDSIVDLLGKGYTPSTIARMLECSTSLVSQVQKENADRIEQIASDARMVAVLQDDMMDDIEATLLMKLQALAAIETDSTKVLKMFQTINTAKRRSRGEGQLTQIQNNVTNNIAQLQLPATLGNRVQFVTSSRNEVIEIEGRSIVSASNTQIMDELRALQDAGRTTAADRELQDVQLITK